MYETSLDKVLNYMKQYVENRFEHDSEPMLNYKDLELVLNHINKQQEVINKINKKLDKYDEVFNNLDNFINEECKGYWDVDATTILRILEEIKNE